MSYRPKIKLNAAGDTSDLALDAETVKGVDVVGAINNIKDGSTIDSFSDVETALNGKQPTLATQTAYTTKGSATVVPQITTNTLGQVTTITEKTITAVRYDTNSQGLDATQKSNARTNIGLGSAATKTAGSAAGNVPVLDSNAKLDSSLLPAIAITDTFVVASQSAMLELTAQVGDVAVRTDQNKSYILKTAGASTLSNWQELLTPTDAVTSVNNKTGAVTLSASSTSTVTPTTVTLRFTYEDETYEDITVMTGASVSTTTTLS